VKIAQRVELPRSTVHRIAAALEAESLVVPALPGGGYRLGPELARIAASAGGELSESVRPFIERLRYEVDETVDLAVLNSNRERLAELLLRTCAEVSATLGANGHAIS
jgi:DNA-binding IclR family transcriptional regulator